MVRAGPRNSTSRTKLTSPRHYWCACRLNSILVRHVNYSLLTRAWILCACLTQIQQCKRKRIFSTRRACGLCAANRVRTECGMLNRSHAVCTAHNVGPHTRMLCVAAAACILLRHKDVDSCFLYTAMFNMRFIGILFTFYASSFYALCATLVCHGQSWMMSTCKRCAACVQSVKRCSVPCSDKFSPNCWLEFYNTL